MVRRVGFWWDNRRNEGPTTTASIALRQGLPLRSDRKRRLTMSEQCHAFIYVPFNERPSGRRRCRNWTTHRSGLCWLHRHTAIPDDDRKRP